jgi:hypothetical protein
MKAANSVGWGAVVLVTLASSFWAFWGVNEAFHEGWCKPYLWMRLLQLVAYIGPSIVLCALTPLSVHWPRAGATLSVLVGVTIAALIIADKARFGLFISITLVVIPVLVGMAFLFGHPTPKSAACAVSVAIPLVIVLVCGAEPIARVSTRFDDGNRGARVIEGNGITLQWAPAGPGWTRDGLVSWDEAVARARRLTDDGTALADEPQDTWRLPNREEIVESLTRGNRNAGGTWDALSERPSYARRPDKESPLWDPYAPLIYLWTADEASQYRAWIVVYNGGVYAKPKATGSPSFGFRAVREPSDNRE